MQKLSVTLTCILFTPFSFGCACTIFDLKIGIPLSMFMYACMCVYVLVYVLINSVKKCLEQEPNLAKTIIKYAGSLSKT